MNTIIVIDNGVVQTPILIKSNKKADITYEGIVKKYLGDDEIKFFDDFVYDKVNRLLPAGTEIHYFTNL
jgi:hypothetical protein